VSETTTWVARRVREARDHAGLTQAELAERLDVTQTAVSYWEGGKRAPGLDDLIAIADALNQPVTYFLPLKSSRESIRTLLRATADRLDARQLRDVLDALLDEAEALPGLKQQVAITTTDPQRAASELLQLTGTASPPIDVDALAEQCGAHVITRELESDLSGLVIALDEGAVIGINRAQSKQRRRFTVAHELGHYLLDHHDRFHLDFARNAEDGHPPGYDWRSERAANEFAAQLLMPEHLVHTQFEPLAGSVKRLAKAFEVSELAMSYRLQSLGLR
jgi:transcriptional regulator with XRE-family HTH domain